MVTAALLSYFGVNHTIRYSRLEIVRFKLEPDDKQHQVVWEPTSNLPQVNRLPTSLRAWKRLRRWLWPPAAGTAHFSGHPAAWAALPSSCPADLLPWSWPEHHDKNTSVKRHFRLRRLAAKLRYPSYKCAKLTRLGQESEPTWVI